MSFKQILNIITYIALIHNTAKQHNTINNATLLITIKALNCMLMCLWNIFANIQCFSSKQDLSAFPVTISLFSFILGAHFAQQGVSALISGTLFVPGWASSLQQEQSRKPHVAGNELSIVALARRSRSRRIYSSAAGLRTHRP